MLLFCPTCANILECEEGQGCFRFACSTCPYVYNITRRITNKTFTKLKEVDDVLGGAAAWQNVDSTDVDCPRLSCKVFNCTRGVVEKDLKVNKESNSQAVNYRRGLYRDVGGSL